MNGPGRPTKKNRQHCGQKQTMKCKLKVNIASVWQLIARRSRSSMDQERLKRFIWGRRAGGVALFGMATATASTVDTGLLFQTKSCVSGIEISHCLAADSGSQKSHVNVIHSKVEDEAVMKYVDQILGPKSNVNIPGFPGKQSRKEKIIGIKIDWRFFFVLNQKNPFQ